MGIGDLEQKLARSRLILPLILAVYLVAVFIIVPRARLDADEGFYCAAAKRVMAGKLPYRDFGYSQTPLLPYVNGLAMQVTGYGHHPQRYVNAFWGLLTLVVFYYLGTFLGDKYAALLTLWLTATSWNWIYNTALGKAYGATGLFLALTALAVFAPWSAQKRTWLFAVAATLTIGSRLTMAPMLVLLWAGLIYRAAGTRERALAALAPVVVGAVALLPFFLADPANAQFWTFDFHRAQSIVRRGWRPLLEFWLLSPSTVVVLVAAAAALLAGVRNLKTAAGGLYLSALAGVGVHQALKYGYGEYSTPYVPHLLLASITLLLAYPRLRKLSLLLLLLPTLNLVALPEFSKWPGAAAEVARFIRENTPRDAEVLTPMPIIAIDGQREIVPGLEMGKFALTTELPPPEAKRRHLHTPESLAQRIEQRKVAAVVLHDMRLRSRWNFAWSIPSFRRADADRMNHFSATLSRHYQLGFEQFPFVVLTPRESPP